MAKFCSLASSSSGNSSYISASGTTVLVDAGISCKRMCLALNEIDCTPSDIDAVLITHEHIDHIKGLRLFLQKSGASVCASALVLEHLIEKNLIAPSTKLIETGSTPFTIGNLEIMAFSTPHDSVGSVGYRINTSDEHSIGLATDIGKITPTIANALSGCEFVMLEANYDATLLKMGNYPYFLKQRISSALGHLDNQSSATFARELVQKGTKHLVLGHLSKENNNSHLAKITVEQEVTSAGAVCGEDFTLQVSPYDNVGKLMRF